MTTFIKPAWSLLAGLFLTVCGIALAVIRYPGHVAFTAVWHASLDLFNVSFFIICLACGIAGLVMLVIASHGVKQRCREISHVYGTGPHHDNYLD